MSRLNDETIADGFDRAVRIVTAILSDDNELVVGELGECDDNDLVATASCLAMFTARVLRAGVGPGDGRTPEEHQAAREAWARAATTWAASDY